MVKGKMAKGKSNAPGKGKGATSLAAAAPAVTPPQLAEPKAKDDTVVTPPAVTPAAPDVTGPPPAEPKAPEDDATLPATIPDPMPTPAEAVERCEHAPPLTTEGHEGNDAKATAPAPSPEAPIPDQQATPGNGGKPTGTTKGKGYKGKGCKGKKGKKGKGTPTTPDQPTMGQPATPQSTLATKGGGKDVANRSKGLGKAKGDGKTKSGQSTPVTSPGEISTPSSEQAGLFVDVCWLLQAIHDTYNCILHACMH